MKYLSIVADYPGWTRIDEVFEEMSLSETRFRVQHPEQAAEKDKAALEPILLERFSHLDFDFCFCFRCLTKDSGWVSKARLEKNDPNAHTWFSLNKVERASRTLGMDIVIYQEDLIPIKNDMKEIKLLLGNEFWRFLQVTLPKYKRKIPITKEELNDMLDLFHRWLIQQNWIKQ